MVNHYIPFKEAVHSRYTVKMLRCTKEILLLSPKEVKDVYLLKSVSQYCFTYAYHPFDLNSCQLFEQYYIDISLWYKIYFFECTLSINWKQHTLALPHTRTLSKELLIWRNIILYIHNYIISLVMAQGSPHLMNTHPGTKDRRWGPYMGQNLPKVGSRYCPHEILHRPPKVDIYYHSIPKGISFWITWIFPC